MNTHHSPAMFSAAAAAAAPTLFRQPSENSFGSASRCPACACNCHASSAREFGGSSMVGHRPAFGGFGSALGHESSLPNRLDQTQAAIGSNLFGSTTTFGASSKPTFAASIQTTPAFGPTTTPSFDSTQTGFGFSSGPPLGSSLFGVSSQPAFGATSQTAPTFGHKTTQALGFTTTPLFGSTGSRFGVSSGPTFGSALATPAFCSQTSTQFGFVPSSFGSQTSLTDFQGQSGATFNPTPKKYLQSISAMPVYNDKSHEELRWEDYHFGKKGSSTVGHRPAFGGFGSVFGDASPFRNPFQQTQAAFGSNLLGSTTTLGVSSKPTFGASIQTTPAFGPTTTPSFDRTHTGFGFSSGPPLGSSLFGASSQPAFGATSQTAPAFGSTTNPSFGSTGSRFGVSSGPAFGSALATPAFCSQTSAQFGFVPSSFGPQTSLPGSSVVTNVPPFRGFGSTVGQASPFSSTPQKVEPAFGSNMISASSPFGPPCQLAFSAPTQTALATPPFAVASTPTFGSSSTPSFGFSTAPVGQSTSTYSNTAQRPFASQSSLSGFEHSVFGGKPRGSRVAAYISTPEDDGLLCTQLAGNHRFGPTGGKPRGSRVAHFIPTLEGDGTESTGNLESISAMHFYKDKSHEELRWEDYLDGDKGSSVFEQKTAFGGFKSSPMQASPFDSMFQKSQRAYGSNIYGTAVTPAFGSIPPPPPPPFGSVAAPSFGTGGTGFCVSSALAYGSFNRSAYGNRGTPSFGSSVPDLYGASRTPAFGSPSSLGSSSSRSFSFGNANPFGQSTSRATPLPFGSQSSLLGQPEGSQVAAYRPTPEADMPDSTQPAGYLESIAAMPVYQGKSHEELRWEDYQLRYKGSSLFGQKIAFGGFRSCTMQASPSGNTSQQAFGSNLYGNIFGNKGFGPTGFGGQPRGSRVAAFVSMPEHSDFLATQSTGKLESISAMHVYKDKSHEELRWEDYQYGDKVSRQNATFGGFESSPTQASPFDSIFQHSQPAYGSNLYGNAFPPAFGSTTTAAPLFGSVGTGLGAPPVPTFGSGSAYSSLGSPSTPMLFGQSTSTAGSSPFGTTASPFGSQSCSLGQPGGSQVAAFVTTPEAGMHGAQPDGNLKSITAMPVYEGKSHEELRWEDYQNGYNGGASLFGQPSSEINIPAPTEGNPFGSTRTFDRPQENRYTYSRTSRTQPGTWGGFGFIIVNTIFGETSLLIPCFFLYVELNQM